MLAYSFQEKKITLHTPSYLREFYNLHASSTKFCLLVYWIWRKIPAHSFIRELRVLLTKIQSILIDNIDIFALFSPFLKKKGLRKISKYWGASGGGHNLLVVWDRFSWSAKIWGCHGTPWLRQTWSYLALAWWYEVTKSIECSIHCIGVFTSYS